MRPPKAGLPLPDDWIGIFPPPPPPWPDDLPWPDEEEDR